MDFKPDTEDNDDVIDDDLNDDNAADVELVASDADDSDGAHSKARRSVDKLMERKRLRDELGSVFDEDSIEEDSIDED